jgi:hypothetical protein
MNDLATNELDELDELDEDDRDTATLALSPEFLAALRSIAPARRGVSIGYVLAFALTTVAGVGLGHPLTREFVARRAHDTTRLVRALLSPGADTPEVLEERQSSAMD